MQRQRFELKGKDLILIDLIDTSANVTVISKSRWSSDLPLTTVSQMLSGVDGKSKILQRKHLVQIASVKPFMLCVPLVLLGKDLLTQWSFRGQSKFFEGSLKQATL